MNIRKLFLGVKDCINMSALKKSRFYSLIEREQLVMFKKIIQKLKIDLALDYCFSWITKTFWKEIAILNFTETIDYVIKNKASLSRFGDGELTIAAHGASIGFQRADQHLQKKLIEVLQKPSPHLLVCLPLRINQVKGSEYSKLDDYWKQIIKKDLYKWSKLIKQELVYGDTNVTRLVDYYGLSEGSKCFDCRGC